MLHIFKKAVLAAAIFIIGALPSAHSMIAIANAIAERKEANATTAATATTATGATEATASTATTETSWMESTEGKQVQKLVAEAQDFFKTKPVITDHMSWEAAYNEALSCQNTAQGLHAQLAPHVPFKGVFPIKQLYLFKSLLAAAKHPQEISKLRSCVVRLEFDETLCNLFERLKSESAVFGWRAIKINELKKPYPLWHPYYSSVPQPALEWHSQNKCWFTPYR